MLFQKGDTMLLEELKTILLRDIAGVERELDLYPDDESVWKNLPGLPNSAGNLILHLAGGSQYFFGTALGNTSYVRNREAEFTKKDIPRHELKKELLGARQAVLAGFAAMTEEKLEQPFPVRITDTDLSTRLTILQLVTHIAYHLGQVDYHRRVITGNSASADTLSADDLIKK
jgi:hypothetical protein